MTARVLRESFTEERQAAQVVVHQRNRRAVDRHFAARRAHRDADVARRERGRVVHAVADDRDFVAFQFHRADKFHLVLRQAIALRLFAADFGGDARGDNLTVAGNHRDAADAGFFQFGQRLPWLRRASGPANQPSRRTGRRARQKSDSSLRSR